VRPGLGRTPGGWARWGWSWSSRLDAAIAELAATPTWAPVVARLASLRGVGVLTGFGLAVEIGDWHRFTAATVGAWLGLVPSEQSSGGRRRQGSITKTGNSHARRLLVEAAWHHRNPYRPSRELRADRTDSPRWSETAPTAATVGCISAGAGWTLGASAPPSAWSRSPASLPDGAGAWPSWTPDPASKLAGGAAPTSAWSDPRHSYEQPGRVHRAG
jgi:transposase